MLVRSPVFVTLVLLGFAACRHDVTGFVTKGSSGPDAGSPDGHGDRDAGPPEESGGTGHDAGMSFPYRWLENNPGEGREEGKITFKLECSRDGQYADGCVFGCAYDTSDFRSCRDTFAVWSIAGSHELCVRVQAPGTDPEFAGRTQEQCVHWTTKPYSHPFFWVSVTPDPKSTELDLPLSCAQEPAPDTGSVVRSDCGFRCSLDHIPYANCVGSFQASGVKPGSHELRVEACGPFGHEAAGVCRVRLLKFDIDSNAEPAVPVESVPNADTLERAQLGNLAALIDPYVAFAPECASSLKPAENEYLIREYLSYVRARLPTVTDDAIAACKQALTARPAQCRSPAGTTEHFDMMLQARLPSGCLNFWGPVQGHSGDTGERCLVHGECGEGLCERMSDWIDSARSYGYCTGEGEAEEGIMCLNRGCSVNLYCSSGVCVPAGKLGSPCIVSRKGIDCQKGLTCTGGTPSTCAPPVAGIGEHCAIPTDCREGQCDLALKKCVAAPLTRP